PATADTRVVVFEPVRLPAAHLLTVWPSDMDSEAAAAIADDYRRPAALAVHNGRLLRGRDGDFDRDGYNEAEGVYELELDDGLLRLRLDPGPAPRERVRLRVAGAAGRECWVYADGRIVQTVGRDA